jgi:glyoxylase-like metal-dependent hydrolase (beta-lactamase superfamily II)
MMSNATTGPKLSVQAPAGFYPFTVGRLRCLTISDGFVPTEVEMLGFAVDADDIAGHLRRRGHDITEMRSQISCLLVADPEHGRTTLIDTGIGSMPGPSGAPLPTAGKLVENLCAAGFDPGEVDTVLLSHLHPDHIGGAFDPAGRPAFPQAHLFASEEEVAFWSADAPDLSRLLVPPEAAADLVRSARRFIDMAGDRLHTFQTGSAPVPGITAIGAPGHTPGQVGYLVESDNADLLYTGDAFGHAVLSVECPEWPFALDSDPETAVRTRQRLIEDLGARRGRFFTPHFPWPNLGRIGAVGTQAVWTAEPYDWAGQ